MRQRKITRDEAEEIATAAFGLLAEEPERTARFLNLSGLNPEDLRAIAGTSEFHIAVLDYVRRDESLLLVLAARQGVDAERIALAERELAGAVDE